jgi:phosphatidylglycerol:prolipoprotein diacylglycerol transferase
MSILNYIIWNGSPEIFSIGPVTLRWYGLLFALGFLISQQILYYMYKQEGKPEDDVNTLTIYMVVATILGARLGHVIFYQPEIIWQDPLGIFLPFQFSPEFKFTGLQGLASHGGAFGILFALWLYARKNKPGQNYLQVLDRIVILVALTGALIRFGNYFNSEIIGKPTDSPMGVVFVSRVTEALRGNPDDPNNLVKNVVIEKDPKAVVSSDGKVPIKIYLFFKPGIPERNTHYYLRGTVKQTLFYMSEFLVEPATQDLHFQTVLDEKNNQVMARITTVGIVRHPAQLYESLSCVVLFIILFAIWQRHKINLPEGRIFGLFMIILWSLRFAYEYLKENQVPFEDKLPLNMGQILSIPLVLVGIYILSRSYRQPSENA